MRFIRQEHIVTTIVNKNIDDTDQVKSVLESLKKLGINFSLILKKHFQSDYSYHNINHNDVRVKRVGDEDADFIVFNKSALTCIKDIKFEDIVEIRAITEKNQILKAHPETNRFGLMDIEDD
jgi:hypothetical protein